MPKNPHERGEDPEGARLAALSEFGYVPTIRDSMRRVWYSRWLDSAAALAREMQFALRTLQRARGLATTVVVTLALGIGANAAIFSVVRGVLLRPLVNRDEDRLIDFYQEATRRVGALPGVEGVAVGSFVPWRDAGSFGPGVSFAVEGYKPADDEETRARGFALWHLASLPCSASRCSTAATSLTMTAPTPSPS